VAFRTAAEFCELNRIRLIVIGADVTQRNEKALLEGR